MGGEIKVQSLSTARDREPTKFAICKARLPGEPREAWERARAAWLLARQGIRALHPGIRRLEVQSVGAEQKACVAALRLLEVLA